MDERLRQKAQSFGAMEYLDWLVEKLGPVLADLIIDVIAKRLEPEVQRHCAAITAQTSEGKMSAGGFDVTVLLVTVLQKIGPNLEQGLVEYLNTRTDVLSKFGSMVLAQVGPQLTDLLVAFLQSQAGQVALSAAVAAESGRHGMTIELDSVGKPVGASGINVGSVAKQVGAVLWQFLVNLLQTQQAQQAVASAIEATTKTLRPHGTPQDGQSGQSVLPTGTTPVPPAPAQQPAQQTTPVTTTPAPPQPAQQSAEQPAQPVTTTKVPVSLSRGSGVPPPVPGAAVKKSHAGQAPGEAVKKPPKK